MKNQILAMIIAAIMRFYLGTSLMIMSMPCETRMSFISHLLVFIAACFYSFKIKLCPDLKNHLLLTIIETAIGIAMIEFMMGLWCSVEKIIVKIVKCGLSDDVEMAKAVVFADMITMGLATCMLLSVLIDGQLVQKAMVYYNKRASSSKCEPQPRGCAPQQQQRARPANASMYRNPNCPCHGDNFM